MYIKYSANFEAILVMYLIRSKLNIVYTVGINLLKKV